MLRRAKDVVSNTDVPLLLQLPGHTHHDVLYNIMTQCNILHPRVYTTLDELPKANARHVGNNYYVNIPVTVHRDEHAYTGRPYFHF